jgi:hypothetical protein
MTLYFCKVLQDLFLIYGFPCLISLYYVKNQQDANLAVFFLLVLVLFQDRDRWRALVSTARNLRVPKMRGISWLAAEPVSFSRRTLLHGVLVLVLFRTLIRLWHSEEDNRPWTSLLDIHYPDPWHAPVAVNTVL